MKKHFGCIAACVAVAVLAGCPNPNSAEEQTAVIGFTLEDSEVSQSADSVELTDGDWKMTRMTTVHGSDDDRNPMDFEAWLYHEFTVSDEGETFTVTSGKEAQVAPVGDMTEEEIAEKSAEMQDDGWTVQRDGDQITVILDIDEKSFEHDAESIKEYCALENGERATITANAAKTAFKLIVYPKQSEEEDEDTTNDAEPWTIYIAKR